MADVGGDDRAAAGHLGALIGICVKGLFVGAGGVALSGTTDGKAAVTVAVTSDSTDRVNAADLAREAVLAMDGKCAGGKPDFAQGGAPDASKAEAGLQAIRDTLEKL